MEPLFFVILALLLGTATRHIFRKSPIPYTVLLVIIGFLLGLLDKTGTLHHLEFLKESIAWAGNIDPHLILFVFLPTLIFEAAFAMDFHTFKKTATNSMILAIPGILVAFFLTAAGILAIINLEIGLDTWTWGIAMLFGAVISATDPVAVVALLKELGASKKLSTLIEGESLLNDGTGIVLFIIVFTGLTGLAAGSPLGSFFKVAIGGVLIGLVIAAFTIAWVRRVFNDALVEITLMIVAAYLTFFIAEEFFHVSGILGLVALGLTMTSVGKTRITPEVQHFLHEFWEFAAFLANTLIFIIVGVVIAERSIFSANDFIILFIIYIIINIVRAIMLLMFYPLMKKAGYGLNKEETVILWWGALRGAVGLAMALIVAGEESIDETVRNQFLFYVAGIVMLTLIINATTIKWVINKLGLTEIPPAKALMMANTYKHIVNDSNIELDVLKSSRFLGNADWSAVKNFLPNPEIPEIKQEYLSQLKPLTELRRRILEREKSSYWNQFKEGLLSPTAVRKLSDELNYILDKGGEIPLNERHYLLKIVKTPSTVKYLSKIPLLQNYSKKWLFNDLVLSYDVLKGFIQAQEDVKKLAASIDYDINQDNITDEQENQIKSILTEEIQLNRLMALNLLKDLHHAYPEIGKAIETRQATRALLNYEKENILKFKKDGKLENDEAEKLFVDIEHRIKKLVFSPVSAQLATPEEVLREVSWLQNIDENIIQHVLSIAEVKEHNRDEVLIHQGESGEKGMLLIIHGSVKVKIEEKLIDILGTGSVIGEMSVLAGIPRTANVVADTPVTAIWL